MEENDFGFDLNCIDKFSVKGKYIKKYMMNFTPPTTSITITEMSTENPAHIPEPVGLRSIDCIDYSHMHEFFMKYCTGPKAIKDDIYYFINAKRNNYEFLTLQRDLNKSPRKESKQKISAKPYKATYDNIEKDPEMIANYYSKKYSISDKENIVAIMTEDDVLCLNCGCISDQRLSDVPDLKTHISNMACPKCGSTTSTLVTFNKYLHKTSMHCRDAQK